MLQKEVSDVEVPPKNPPRRRLLPQAQGKPYLWLIPAYALLLFVVAYPIVSNVGSSFTKTAAGGTEYVGLDQYASLLSDPSFYSSSLKTLYWTLGVTVLQFVAGAALAVAADRNTWFVRRTRTMLILPWALPGVVAANIWVFLYNEDGLINAFLSWTGIALREPWLANPDTALLAVIVAAGWKGFPFYFLLLLAGLQSVPQETREAAQIDGASSFQTLFRVVLPQMKPIIITSLILGIIGTINYFDGIYLMTGGGPVSATETLPVWVYNMAFARFDIAKASTLSVIILLLVIIPAVIWVFVAGRKKRT